MAAGLAYLGAMADVHSRRILAWRLSNTPDARMCVDALEEALVRHGRPEGFNSGQGNRFASRAFTSVPEGAGMAVLGTATGTSDRSSGPFDGSPVFTNLRVLPRRREAPRPRR